MVFPTQSGLNCGSAKRFADGEKNEKGTVLNSDISSVISRLGHTDTLVVCDAGLPIPKSTTRIDMALTQGVPSLCRCWASSQMKCRSRQPLSRKRSNNIIRNSTKRCSLTLSSCKTPGNTIEIRYTTHEQFKQQTAESQAVIRSGECSPYANIILCAGVTF